ncbi:carbohydrate sulfotransferase 3-like [Glandiceps talaboti]
MSIDGVNLLSNIYECNFKTYAELWEKYFKWRSPHGVTKHTFKNEQCLRFLSSTVTTCCKKALHKAVKVIRMLDIRDVIPLMEKRDLNLKVINTVRDPRAMVNSLIPYYSAQWDRKRKPEGQQRDIKHLNEFTMDVLKYYCEVMLRNYLLFRQNSTQAWKKNFLVLRFEDIALNQKEYADIMYNHVGIEVHKDVYTWIDNNSLIKKEQHGGWGTIRNRTAEVYTWRSTMTFALVQKIQNVSMCRKYMRSLRYQFVKSESELKNKEKPFFLPLS